MIADALYNNSDRVELLYEIQEYKNLSAIYTEFRTGKRFKCTDIKYNNTTGRLTSMSFVEI